MLAKRAYDHSQVYDLSNSLSSFVFELDYFRRVSRPTQRYGMFSPLGQLVAPIGVINEMRRFSGPARKHISRCVSFPAPQAVFRSAIFA